MLKLQKIIQPARKLPMLS